MIVRKQQPQQALGDAGFVGLAIFLAILLRTWRACGRLIKQTAAVPELEWIHNLARALRVSFVAYGVAGAGLNMAYFEMFYVFVVLVAIQEQMVKRHFQTVAPTNPADPSSIGAGMEVMTEGGPPVRFTERPL